MNPKQEVLLNSMPLADDPQLTTTMATAMQTFEDDRLLHVILAAGLVASVLLIVSTTEFDGKIGLFTFHKGRIDPDTIKAVLGGVYGGAQALIETR